MVISNNSGERGASLARRNYGENVACSIEHASWRYCDRFRDYVGRERELPFDQHMLLGLVAPRPVYVASATRDSLADPKGEITKYDWEAYLRFAERQFKEATGKQRPLP